jgi:hypothetical protein
VDATMAFNQYAGGFILEATNRRSSQTCVVAAHLATLHMLIAYRVHSIRET